MAKDVEVRVALKTSTGHNDGRPQQLLSHEAI
jgi:hypothetical protein